MVDSNSIYMFTGKFLIGALIFIRVMGFMTAAPIFNNVGIPMMMKILFSVILSVSITSAFWDKQIQIDIHAWYLVFLVLKEFVCGLAIGFAVSVVFWGARMAGGLIDFDMGYHTSAIFSAPETSPTLIGELYYMMALILFFSINGHHFMIEAMFASFKAVPLTLFAITGSTVKVMVQLATEVLIVAIKIAAPILIAMFLTNLALSLLARVAPQTNIFSLSFSIKIVVGLLVLFATAPLTGMVIKQMLQVIDKEVMKFILTLNPSRV